MTAHPPGRFITLEGIEGAGKTCHLAYIHAWLERAGKTVCRTREPGGTPLGEAIRELLLQPRASGMTAHSELLLLFAARAEHLEQIIRPALARGEWVLCDRFTDASFAYQGGGRGLDVTLIQQLADAVQDGLQPHLTLLLDLPIELGLARVRQRGAPDRLEQENFLFFERVRRAYLSRAAALPDRIRCINAALPLPEVQLAIGQVLSSYCE